MKSLLDFFKHDKEISARYYGRRKKSEYSRYESLVLEGGGCKFVGYLGALQVLEEHKLLDDITKFAGTSIGSLISGLLALGLSPAEIKNRIYDMDIPGTFKDARFGIFSFLYNFWKEFGWHPASHFEDWFKNICEEYYDLPELTFGELYKKTGRELCVVVVSLTRASEIYCHPKTTPNFPIYKAIRMSISLPGFFQAQKAQLFGSSLEYFVDGGIICNYPIHAFDGWWLSMKDQDSFFKRLHNYSEMSDSPEVMDRFNPRNSKTLGMILYGSTEGEFRKDYFENLLVKNDCVCTEPRPKTKLAKKFEKQQKLIKEKKTKSQAMTDAVSDFMRALSEANIDEQAHEISLKELEAALKILKPENGKLLFGEHYTAGSVMVEMDVDRDYQISFPELMRFAESKSVNMYMTSMDVEKSQINNVSDFFINVCSTVIDNGGRIFFKNEDVERTIGINVDYLGTTDFEMTHKDMDYVYNRGRKAAIAFLKEKRIFKDVRKIQEAESTHTAL